MNRRRLNQFKLNVSQLNTFVLNAKGIKEKMPSGSSADISQAIMDSLVCWYDIGKQQCTNESMAANPVLADLSGNGHDITCYNFAWAGMSGIGEYIFEMPSSQFYTYNSTANFLSTHSVQFTKVNIPTSLEEVNRYLMYYFPFGIDALNGNYTFPSVKLRIENPNGANLRLGLIYHFLEDFNIEFNDSRIIEVPNIDIECNNQQLALGLFFLDATEGEVDTDITVELLPQYPNALVSDGVDDYCYTDGLPILTDYTVIAKRKWLSTEIPNNHINLACKGITQGAFIFERLEKSSNVDITYSFGHINGIDTQANDITYQTSTSYNGINIKKGENIDVDDLILCSRYTTSGFAQIALYSFLLFDRTLTTAEIEWVKKNMIESGGGC